METLNLHRNVAGVLLAVMLLLGSCSQEAEPPAPAREEPLYSGTIVAVGDSLTAGLGVAEELSYPAQLQKKMQAQGLNYRVINAGVSGETSSGTLSRLGWILTMKPDIVILETGANDGLRGIDPIVPRENIEEILRILQEHDIITILAGMKMVWNLGPAYTAAFNSIYPEIASRRNVLFIPFFLDGVATIAELNTKDGLHPNGAGYGVVVEKIYPYVVQAIERLEKDHAAE